MTKIIIKCPCCSSKCLKETWFDGDFGTNISCQCGYRYTDCCGDEKIILPNGKSWVYSYETSIKELDRIHKEIDKEIKSDRGKNYGY